MKIRYSHEYSGCHVIIEATRDVAIKAMDYYVQTGYAVLLATCVNDETLIVLHKPSLERFTF